MVQNLHELDDGDAALVLTNLSNIIKLAHEIAMSGNTLAHEIYILARDSRDAMVMDATSREVLRKLRGPVNPEVNGLVISPEVQAHAMAGRKIDAIKQLRHESNAGLKEAKDAVEAWVAQTVTF